MTRIQLRDMSGHEANIRFQERNEHDPLTGRRYDGRRDPRLASRPSRTRRSPNSHHMTVDTSRTAADRRDPHPAARATLLVTVTSITKRLCDEHVPLLLSSETFESSGFRTPTPNTPCSPTAAPAYP